MQRVTSTDSVSDTSPYFQGRACFEKYMADKKQNKHNVADLKEAYAHLIEIAEEIPAAYLWLAKIKQQELIHAVESDIPSSTKEKIKNKRCAKQAEYLINFSNEFKINTNDSEKYLSVNEYLDVCIWVLEQAKYIHTEDDSILDGEDYQFCMEAMLTILDEINNNYDHVSPTYIAEAEYLKAKLVEESLKSEKPGVDRADHLQIRYHHPDVADLLMEITRYYLHSALYGKTEAFDALIAIYATPKTESIQKSLRNIYDLFKQGKMNEISTIDQIQKLNEQLFVYFRTRALSIKLAIVSYYDIKHDVAQYLIRQPFNQKSYLSLLDKSIEFLNTDFEMMKVDYLGDFIAKQNELLAFQESKRGQALLDEEKEKEKEQEKEQEKMPKKPLGKANVAAKVGSRKSKNKRKKLSRKKKEEGIHHHPIYPNLKRRFVTKVGQETLSKEKEGDIIQASKKNELEDSKIWEGIALPNTIKHTLDFFEEAYLVGSQARERLCLANQEPDYVEDKMLGTDIDIVTSDPLPENDIFTINIEGENRVFVRCGYNPNLYQNFELNIDVYFCDLLQYSLVKSAHLRDFTINAFHIDKAGNAFAPIKQSVPDLVNEVIRPIDPAIYANSPGCILRNLKLRALKFKEAAGSPPLAEQFVHLSSDKFSYALRYKTINKLLTHGLAVDCFKELHAEGLDAVFFPGISDYYYAWLLENFSKTDTLYHDKLRSFEKEAPSHSHVSGVRVFSLILLARLLSDKEKGLEVKNLQVSLKALMDEWHFPAGLQEKILLPSEASYINRALSSRRNEKMLVMANENLLFAQPAQAVLRNEEIYYAQPAQVRLNEETFYVTDYQRQQEYAPGVVQHPGLNGLK